MLRENEYFCSKMLRSENNLKGIFNKTLTIITILFCEGGEKPVYLVEKEEEEDDDDDDDDDDDEEEEEEEEEDYDLEENKMMTRMSKGCSSL